jgi:hypothetical protein
MKQLIPFKMVLAKEIIIIIIIIRNYLLHGDALCVMVIPLSYKIKYIKLFGYLGCE